MNLICPEKQKETEDEFLKNLEICEQKFEKFVVPAKTDLIAGPQRFDRHNNPVVPRFMNKKNKEKSVHKVTWVDQINSKAEKLKENTDVTVSKENKKTVFQLNQVSPDSHLIQHESDDDILRIHYCERMQFPEEKNKDCCKIKNEAKK